ncbi:MAG: hypothetical protein KJ767_03745 [Nanoarchaeota archaeon]|nr:hypothetical protein [Nanoarchaeota archaeon]
MKNWYKGLIAGASLLAMPLLNGCVEKSIDFMELKGTVFSESYMPAGYGRHSRYSFSMDTRYGRKGIQVEERENTPINKETIDALIEPGTIIEIIIPRPNEGEGLERFYIIYGEQINILGILGQTKESKE